jgi:antitoxin VapB
MAFSFKNEEADRLAREIAGRTGESLTETVIHALRERLERLAGLRSAPSIREDIARMQARIARLPMRDTRSDDEILGYDEQGLPF